MASSILKIHNREAKSEGVDGVCGGGLHEWRCVGITCHVILVHIYRGGKHAATQRQAERAEGRGSNV